MSIFVYNILGIGVMIMWFAIYTFSKKTTQEFQYSLLGELMGLGIIAMAI